MDRGRAARIALGIARGLAAAHDRGFVHRDLKPANVMLLPDDGAKILDFGLTGLMEGSGLTRLTRQDQLLGTPSYMAPEQITSAASAGVPADLYALGAVLYAMLAGRPPFEGSGREVLGQHLRDPPPPLPHDGRLERLAMRLLAKPPEARPGSATEVASTLAAATPPRP